MSSFLSIWLQENRHRNLKNVSKHVQASFFYQLTEEKNQKELNWAWYKSTAHLELLLTFKHTHTHTNLWASPFHAMWQLKKRTL